MIYYQCKFYQTAPLRIGTGEREDSASDVMTDNRGRPFLPGAGIAGVLRTYLNKADENNEEHLFGIIRERTEEELEQARAERKARGERGEPNKNLIMESRVLISDAVLPHDCDKTVYRIVTRDGIGMNDRGTVLQGAKYDFEVVECTEPYTAVIELPDRPADKESADGQEPDAVLLERVLREIVRHDVSFGARTTRGYGQMKVKIRKREFVLPDAMDDWLDFDPLDAEHFGGDELTEWDGMDTAALYIRANLKMDGSFSVRRYLSKLPQTAEKQEFVSNVPVYGPMTNQKERPVIPGTSWAGSFRHHMRTLIKEAVPEGEKQDGLLRELNDLFGTVEKKNGAEGTETIKKKSRIYFSETEVNTAAPQEIENSGEKKSEGRKHGEYTVTRVAVERFTGAPRNQGPFSSVVAWGGQGELTIRLPADTSPELRRLLAAALNDLHMGLLTVGGESSVGRGLCRSEKLTVNEADVTEAVHSCDTGYIALPVAARPGTEGKRR